MKKRVLFVINNMSGGGAEKILHTIICNINTNKFDVTVCSLHEQPSLAEWPENIKYKYIFRHNAKSVIGQFINKITNKLKLIIYHNFSSDIFYRLFVDGKYDTEIAFIEGYATRIVGGSTNSKSKKLAWLHIDMYENHWSRIAFRSDKEEISTYKKFDKIFGVSQSVANSISRLYTEIRATDVMYNPINEKEIRQKSQEYHIERNSSENNFRFISVGRLVEQKGYDRLIPIIADLRLSGYNVELKIIGEGLERNTLEALIKDYNLTNYVELVGYKKNPYPYFVSSDAFVCSSRSEGYSTVISEALILGLPVVSTNCAGTQELLGLNSEYGIITDNSTDSLREGMIKMIESSECAKYKELSERRGSMFSLHELMSSIEKCL